MKKANTKRDKLLTGIYFVILVFLILFLFFNKYGLIKYFELKNEIQSIEQQIGENKKEIKILDDDIKSLKNSDAKLEEVAREKFHMKKKNEKAFRFKDKKETKD
ncbi:MAG: septum formation initiator family protein [Ignavibacteriae bacterium]|nr:septum formation initiator family protein [Ignavibacteriota bacterium]